jgi:hypothetical protein
LSDAAKERVDAMNVIDVILLGAAPGFLLLLFGRDRTRSTSPYPASTR